MIIVVGAGLAGLTCARLLQQQGQTVTVLERSDGVGGRVRTDVRDGFQLDRGFQVLFDHYPAARRQLDLPALELRPFDPGAIICRGGRRAVLTDPLRDRQLSDVLAAAATDELPLMDKLRTLRLVLSLGYGGYDPARLNDHTTASYLRWQGFSAATIDRFFRPFYGGIFLDRTLQTSAAAFAFYFEMLARGQTALPARGMGAVSAQLAAQLTAMGSVRLNTPVAALLREGGRVVGVRTAAGEELRADQVILATDAPTAHDLAGIATPRGAQQTVAVYFAGLRPVYRGKKLALNANADAFVNNAQQLSNVAPEYAPAGRHLLSAVIIGQPALDDTTLVARTMADLQRMWAGDATAQAALHSYYPLAVYRIPYAQFAQPVGVYSALPGNQTDQPGLLVAAEWTESSSINGAITSGERCAALIAGMTKL